MNAVFELGGELVRPDVAHNLMRLIAEGSGEDEDADMALRAYAAQAYYDLLTKPTLPDILLQVIPTLLSPPCSPCQPCTHFQHHATVTHHASPLIVSVRRSITRR